MYKKLVVIEPIQLVPSAEEALKAYAQEIIWYDDSPLTITEKINRIGDSDAVLLSYTSTLEGEVIKACPSLKYIGMCCSLYAPESANVDIRTAQACGVQVRGVRDYGDHGVVEYVVSELVRYLHGFGEAMWRDQPEELTGLKIGIVGLGVSGRMVANALQSFGATLSYYSRSRKIEAEEAGIEYRPFHQLLRENEVIISCLNKHVILFDDEAFQALGHHKILFNTSIGPSHQVEALEKWLKHDRNAFFCDSKGALGEARLLDYQTVHCMNVSSGRTRQAMARLSEKVLKNIEESLVGDQI